VHRLTALFVCACALGCEAPARTPAPPREEPPGSIVVVPDDPDEMPGASHLVYLNREGALLTGGEDDASINRSSVVAMAGLAAYDAAAYGGTPRQFTEIVTCVREHFARYNVTIVDRRPVEHDYVMVVVGGRAGALAQTQEAAAERHIGGLAPYNGAPIKYAVVFAFAEVARNRPRDVCETVSQEIAHAYGLDHTRSCSDLMSYMRPCGRRRFVEDSVPCGEDADRPCGDERPTQSSHERLLQVLGPRPMAPSP
jgi:hypothetical protein